MNKAAKFATKLRSSNRISSSSHRSSRENSGLRSKRKRKRKSSARLRSVQERVVLRSIELWFDRSRRKREKYFVVLGCGSIEVEE